MPTRSKSKSTGARTKATTGKPIPRKPTVSPKTRPKQREVREDTIMIFVPIPPFPSSGATKASPISKKPTGHRVKSVDVTIRVARTKGKP